MAIRQLDWGFQAAQGAPATGFVFLPIQTGTWKVENQLTKQELDEITGTRWGLWSTRDLTRMCKFSFSQYLYFDMTCFPMATHMGAPVTAAVAGATGAFDNTFKPGGTAFKFTTVRYKAISGGSTRWRQLSDGVITTSNLAVTSTGIPKIDFSGYGLFGANISAPGSPPSSTTAAYAQPNTAMQALSLGGVSWRKLKEFMVDVDQGLTPDWDIGAGADYSRSKLGTAKARATVKRFLDDYAGSIMIDHETGDGLLAQIIALITGTTLIGTGTPVATSFTATLPRPFTLSAAENFTEDDDEEDVDLPLGYDTTLASGLSYKFRNELAASVFAGT